ncbi:hypothetical protein SAMN05216489_00984 [Streptomyces sp. 3213]|uniref:hypothetical protein n=1 Tax=Streptomyces sp. 3213.3 TaxID=1855348 RepID=UPI0008990BF4|nr:hypothetical protein [Streptomyces sp. 3213.3]SEC53722.1 hypothetical protein SAMN05216489_00984 [Streptomyces sp. 3213] [Streptomyces sp. 3213.3]
MAPPPVDVRVTRDDDGIVRVTVGGAGPDFTLAVLDVAGAVLSWSVLGDPGPPAAEIHDVGRAQQWLWAVYGERVAAAVHACATGQLAETVVPDDPTSLAADAARLGFGHWAARWWPASHLDGIPALQPDVLGLELAALTHQCQQLFDGTAGDFDGQPDACAAELIEDHRAALDPLIQWWRAASTGPAQQVERVLRLIDDAADGAGLDGPELRRLRSLLDRSSPAATTSLNPGALFARSDGYALAAGELLVTGGRLIARGSGTNDWRRYPAGLVDASENAVSWTARALGARRQFEVEVVAHSAAPTTGAPLTAEIRVNDGPRKRVALARRDDMWTGRTDLDLPPGETRPRVELGVLLPGFDPGPGPETAAERDAIRALVRRRLTAAAQPTANDALPHGSFSAPFLAEIAAATTDEDY